MCRRSLLLLLAAMLHAGPAPAGAEPLRAGWMHGRFGVMTHYLHDWPNTMYRTDETVTFSRRVAEVGGAVTWDVPTRPDGTFAPEYLAQLQAVAAALRAPPVRTAAPPAPTGNVTSNE